MRLITIPLSHYCERARWALDYCGVEYREEQHLQMFHRRPVRNAGGRHTVPVLVTPAGALSDSADIVAYADEHATGGRRLYPEGEAERAEVVELERGFAGEFGVEARRGAYYVLLPQRRLLLRYNAGRAPLIERVALRVGFPFARRTVVRYLNVTDEAVEKGREVIARHFEAVARRLADGRPFLCGDRFTAADLTFAAMAAIVVLPAEYGVPLPAVDELADRFADEARTWREHPAGQYALRLYREHRR